MPTGAEMLNWHLAKTVKVWPLKSGALVPIDPIPGPIPMKILIADDESIYRELLTGILARWPEHQVTAVENGVEAWQLLDDPRRFFDAVFLDIKMPGLGGFEVLRRVRSSPMLQNTGIILCTSHNDRETILKAIQLGTKHFIIKPYTETIVAEKLRILETLVLQSSGSNRDKLRMV